MPFVRIYISKYGDSVDDQTWYDVETYPELESRYPVLGELIRVIEGTDVDAVGARQMIANEARERVGNARAWRDAVYSMDMMNELYYRCSDVKGCINTWADLKGDFYIHDLLRKTHALTKFGVDVYSLHRFETLLRECIVD